MTVRIHGKEYKTVAERLNALHGLVEGKYSLTTDLVSYEGGKVVMKATLTIPVEDTLQTYTGHASEEEESSQINQTSALENCETSAIGRALAAAGFAGTEYASADEVANAIHQQNGAITETAHTPDSPDNWEVERNNSAFKSGKNAGVPWCDLDDGTLEWAVNNHKSLGSWAQIELDYRAEVG